MSSDSPILEGSDADSHRGDPPDFHGAVISVNDRISGFGTARRGPVVVAVQIGRRTVTQLLQDAPTGPAPGAGSLPATVAATGSRSDRREPADAAIGLLLERGEELARIESALTEARTGRGRFVVIEGPAGIGKTALLATVRTAAADDGMRVLRSRGSELERDFAFGVVRQLFEPPLAEASELEQADLLEAAAGRAAGLLALPGAIAADGPPSSGVDPSFAILHGLYWLCANLAATGPLCSPNARVPRLFSARQLRCRPEPS